MYEYETRRMCQAIERELALARARRLTRLGYQPAGIHIDLLTPLRRLWSRRPQPTAPLHAERGAIPAER